MTSDFALGGGLPQGDPCSPILWAVVMDPIMTEMRRLQRQGVGYTINWEEESCHFQTEHHRATAALAVQRAEASGKARVTVDRRGQVHNGLSRTNTPQCKAREQRAKAIKARDAPESRALTATAQAFADDLCGMASSSAGIQRISEAVGLLASFISLKLEPSKIVYLACDAAGKPITTSIKAPALQARPLGQAGFTYNSVVEIPNKLATGCPDLWSKENTARYLGVHFNLALDWTVTLGKLQSKMAGLMANLRHAGASYLAINETIQSVVASRTAFAAQVAAVPASAMAAWEARLAQSILLDLELSTEAAWSHKVHGLFASTEGGGVGFQGIEGAVRAATIMEYMVRRCSPGTEVCEMAEWQDWQWRQDSKQRSAQRKEMAQQGKTGAVPSPAGGSGMGPAARVALIPVELMAAKEPNSPDPLSWSDDCCSKARDALARRTAMAEQPEVPTESDLQVHVKDMDPKFVADHLVSRGLAPCGGEAGRRSCLLEVLQTERAARKKFRGPSLQAHLEEDHMLGPADTMAGRIQQSLPSGWVFGYSPRRWKVPATLAQRHRRAGPPAHTSDTLALRPDQCTAEIMALDTNGGTFTPPEVSSIAAAGELKSRSAPHRAGHNARVNHAQLEASLRDPLNGRFVADMLACLPSETCERPHSSVPSHRDPGPTRCGTYSSGHLAAHMRCVTANPMPRPSPQDLCDSSSGKSSDSDSGSGNEESGGFTDEPQQVFVDTYTNDAAAEQVPKIASDASVKDGTCAIGLIIPGGQPEPAQARGLGLHWQALEPVDSYTGELFGALVGMERAEHHGLHRRYKSLTHVLDNESVAKKWMSSTGRTPTRKRLRSAARCLWNVKERMHATLANTGCAYGVEWLRAYHNTLHCELTKAKRMDYIRNDLVDKKANEARKADSPRYMHLRWGVEQEGLDVSEKETLERDQRPFEFSHPISSRGSEMRHLPYLWGEQEVGLFAPRDCDVRDVGRHLDEDGPDGPAILMLPVSGDIMRALKHRGYAWDRALRWHRLAPTEVSRAIHNGDIGARAVRTSGHGIQLRQRAAVAESVATTLEISRSCGGRGAGSAMSTERALKVVRQGTAADKCPLCGLPYSHAHATECTKTKAYEDATYRAAMGPMSTGGRIGFFGGLGTMDNAAWYAQRAVARAPACLLITTDPNPPAILTLTPAQEQVVSDMVEVPRPAWIQVPSDGQRIYDQSKGKAIIRRTESRTNGTEKTLLQVHTGRRPVNDLHCTGALECDATTAAEQMGQVTMKVAADLIRAELGRMLRDAPAGLESVSASVWQLRFGDACTTTLSMATLTPEDQDRTRRAVAAWGRILTPRPVPVASPQDTPYLTTEDPMGGAFFGIGKSRELLKGQSPGGRRTEHQPRHPLQQAACAAGSRLMVALTRSPDDTLIHVHPAWTAWLRDHCGVVAEWATTWYAHARVPGVQGYLAPEWEWYKSAGLRPASQSMKDIRQATGVAALRGWMGHPTGKRRDHRNGRITEAFRYMIGAMAESKHTQYLWVA
jgi:hypothetical protein